MTYAECVKLHLAVHGCEAETRAAPVLTAYREKRITPAECVKLIRTHAGKLEPTLRRY